MYRGREGEKSVFLVLRRRRFGGFLLGLGILFFVRVSLGFGIMFVHNTSGLSRSPGCSFSCKLKNTRAKVTGRGDAESLKIKMKKKS